MDDIPETRDSLLIRVADARDQTAWEQFARIYRPVVYNVARMRGLQDADAQDVAQQVLLSVSKALPTWERRDESTRFRHWLCRMARNAAINKLTRQPKDRAVGGVLAPVDIAADIADSDLDSRLDREYRRQIFRQAAEHVRTRADATTWQAFAMTMIDGLSISEAAERLQRSEAVIYAARSRIMRRLRDTVKAMEEDHDGKASASAEVAQVLAMLNPTDDPQMLGRIGGYEVSGVIGSGGMGIVLKAFDRPLDRTVAIKVLAPRLASSGAARRRFAREAKAAATVLHPNVIVIHGVSNDGALPFLVMPYLRGESLQKRLDRQGPLPTEEIVRIAQQVASGLAAAHGQGLVHRDIKPANILLEDGVERVTLTDFGLARAVDDASMTRSGVIAGTPQYMSPEQARGDNVDARSDLFSLGSVMYAMCTGRPPFRAESCYGILRKITDTDPRPIREVSPNIPEWLDRIIQRLLAKRLNDRIQTAEHIANLLQRCLAHLQQPTIVELPEEFRMQKHLRGFMSVSKKITRTVAAIALSTVLIAVVYFVTRLQPSLTAESKSTQIGEITFSEAAARDETSLPESEAEKAIARMVLVFYQDQARRAVPGLMIDHGAKTLILTTGPATIVPDGVAHATSRTYLEFPETAAVEAKFIDTTTADVFFHRAKAGLTTFKLEKTVDLEIGDSLSAIILSGQPTLRVTPNAARISALNQATTFSLSTRKFRHKFTGLIQIDQRLPEGTPLFKDGELAGITLLGTRFMKDDVEGSFVVPASRILEVLQQVKTE